MKEQGPEWCFLPQCLPFFLEAAGSKSPLPRTQAASPSPPRHPQPSMQHTTASSLLAQKPQALSPRDSSHRAGLAATSVPPAASSTTQAHPATTEAPLSQLQRATAAPFSPGLPASRPHLPQAAPSSHRAFRPCPLSTWRPSQGGKKTNPHQGLRGPA